MKYRTIVADPPWDMPGGGPQAGTRVWNPGRPSAMPYPTMSAEAIAEIPVETLAEDSAHLYLWTVNHHLRASYGVVETWGFRPSQVLVWSKPPRGLGMGGAFTNTTEFILHGRRGRLAPLSRLDRSCFNWPRGEHSAKPEAFLDLVEQVSPGPYLELFARRNRLGWDTYGNESLNHVELSGGGTANEPAELADGP